MRHLLKFTFLAALCYSVTTFAQVVLTDGSEGPAIKEVAQTESVVLKILGGMLTILAPLLIALVAKAVTWLHSQEKTNKVAYAGSIVGDLTLGFMRAAEAQLRPELQAALADGVLDQKERDALRARIIELVKQQAPNAVMKTLQAAFGAALDTQLGSVAEAAIDHMVETAPVAIAAGPGAAAVTSPR